MSNFFSRHANYFSWILMLEINLINKPVKLCLVDLIPKNISDLLITCPLTLSIIAGNSISTSMHLFIVKIVVIKEAFFLSYRVLVGDRVITSGVQQAIASVGNFPISGPIQQVQQIHDLLGVSRTLDHSVWTFVTYFLAVVKFVI